MKGITASTIATGARFGRTRIASPINTPASAKRVAQAIAASHNAAVTMSFIGCTLWYSTIGLVAVSTAAITPAIGVDATCHAITNADSTSIAAAIGVSQKIASWPNSIA